MNRDNQLEQAIRLIERKILAGLRHGNFEFHLHCRVVQRGRRRLVLIAGESYQFEIDPAELNEAA